MPIRSVCCALFIFCSLPLFGQKADTVIQFSGIVMTSDSLMGIPNVNIYSMDRRYGTSSNFNGFFSFVAQKGDSIVFSAVGYKEDVFIIPEELKGNQYSVIQLLTRDTVYLSETFIYPWPSKEDFARAFLALNIPDDYYEIARKNLERERLKEIGEAMAMDADMNADYQTKALAQKIYYAGQYPPMRIFDVFAWKEFFEAWKRGDFKKD
ncbi:MAG: carboxypeptidase-like regulatory domain-containing protein [Chitinophagales bacterium]